MLRAAAGKVTANSADSQIAMGSASELEYHLLLARDLHMLDAVEYQRLANETVEGKRMLTSFICKLKAES